MRAAIQSVARSAVVVAGITFAARAFADWPPTYSIQHIGLQGLDYDDPSPFQHDYIEHVLPGAIAIGKTTRDGVNGVGGGQDYWLWDGEFTHLIGLTGPEYTGATGFRLAWANLVNQQGRVVGYTSRVIADNTNNGMDAWAADAAGTVLIGLTGPQYTGSSGFRDVAGVALNQAGQVAGRSKRILDLNTPNGYDAWVWNVGATQQIGLLGDIYQGSAGYRSSFPAFQNETGQVAGTAKRIADVNTDLGQDTWVWTNGITQQIGLTGGVFTNSNNYQFSRPLHLNDAGFITGQSTRYDNSLDDFGQSAWVWDGSTTYLVGLTSPDHTGSTGYQSSVPTILTASGLVGGTSVRVLDLNTPNGNDAWLWDGDSTRQLGPTGPEYTGSNGYRTVQLFSVSETGRAIGRTQRILGENTDNGGDLWIAEGDSLHIFGDFGPEYTGTSGYRLSYLAVVADTGDTAIGTRRVLGESTNNGEDWWVWDGQSLTRIGLTGPEYTGSNGYRKNTATSVWNQSAKGKIRGETYRITGVNTLNGKDVWWYDGTTTHLLGLTGPEYTGSNGYRNSGIFMQNAANQIVGTTSRIVNVSSQVSTIAWYFDPATNTTTPIIASVGPAGTYPSSGTGYLTDDGYLLGTFTYFVPGTSATEPHAFIFRPDIGIVDLTNLVEGGVATNGWRNLGNIVGSVSYHTIFGVARRTGSDLGERAFLLRAPPGLQCPACAADYDQDGGVTGGDIGAFFADFETGDACADVDYDGGVTGGDLGAFFAVFEAGGC